jgi:hypothetical protein
MYIDQAKLNEVAVYPDTFWMGLVKIGGIIGIFSIIVAIAKIANERRMKNALADKILEINDPTYDKKAKTCLQKFKNYIKFTPE